jgi:aldose 1-epimerase
MALQAHERRAQPSAKCTSSRTGATASGTAADGGDHRQPRFGVTAGCFRGIAAVTLTDAVSGAYAVFGLRGATLLDWRTPFAGALLSLTDGYRSRAELSRQNGVRNGLMAPFTNRIAAGRYRFAHRDHDLLPGVAEGERLVYHGFLRELDLELCRVSEGDDAAEVLLRTDAIRPGAFPGYPYALALDVLVRFGLHGLSLRVTATNVGHEPAPFAAGWHPYFRFGDEAIDHLELQVPATQAIVAGADLLPLPGAAAYAPLEARPGLDFRAGRVLGGAVIDACLAGLVADEDGLIRSRLRDPVRGCGLTVWQQGGLVHLFTADTLERGARRSVAIEPVETMTDAFNRADCEAAIGLQPGASRSFRCGVRFEAVMPPLVAVDDAPGGPRTKVAGND